MQERFPYTELLPSIFQHISSYYLNYYGHDPRHFPGIREQLNVLSTQTINPRLIMASLSTTAYEIPYILGQSLQLLAQKKKSKEKKKKEEERTKKTNEHPLPLVGKMRDTHGIGIGEMVQRDIRTPRKA